MYCIDRTRSDQHANPYNAQRFHYNYSTLQGYSSLVRQPDRKCQHTIRNAHPALVSAYHLVPAAGQVLTRLVKAGNENGYVEGACRIRYAELASKAISNVQGFEQKPAYDFNQYSTAHLKHEPLHPSRSSLKSEAIPHIKNGCFSVKSEHLRFQKSGHRIIP